jgi:hypothetical protein
MCVAILFDFNVETEKFIPECQTFLTSVISLYSSCLHHKDSLVVQPKSTFYNRYFIQRIFDSKHLKAVRLLATFVDSTDISTSIPWYGFTCTTTLSDISIDSKTKSSQVAREAIVSLSVLLAAQALIKTAINRYKNLDFFPELFEFSLRSLRQLRPQDEPCLPCVIQTNHADLGELLTDAIHAKLRLRSPLQWRFVIINFPCDW